MSQPPGRGSPRSQKASPQLRGESGGGRPRRAADPADRPGARPRAPRAEPELPDDVAASDLDPSVRRELLTLAKDNAEVVARHLVMAGRLADEPERALSHARAAAARAGRVAVARETAGLAAYAAGHYDEALRELRTARRLSGDPSHLPVMADAERGLGRPEKALEMAASPQAQQLEPEQRAEMRIVASGARADLGQVEAAVLELEADRLTGQRRPWHARTYVAHAEALVRADRAAEAPVWLARARTVDPRNESGAFEPAEVSGTHEGDPHDAVVVEDSER